MFSRQTSAQANKVSVAEIPESLNWTAFIDRLSNGDITKHKIIYETNYIECLTLMAYWHFKDKYNERINKMNSLKNK